MSKEIEIRREIRRLNNELREAMKDDVAPIMAKLSILWTNLQAVVQGKPLA